MQDVSSRSRMPKAPPELAKSDSASLLESFSSLVQFWKGYDPEPLQGDDGFPQKPDQGYLEKSPLEFRRFWQIAQSYPDAGLVGTGDEILCGRDSKYSWCDSGYVHLTENTICTTIVGARPAGEVWSVTRLSPGGFEDSQLSVEDYLVSFGLIQLSQEPRRFNGSWAEADNIRNISEYLRAGSQCIWEANLWGDRLRVSFHDQGILWYQLGKEICVSARNAAVYRWFDEHWWRENPTELTRRRCPTRCRCGLEI